MFVSSETNDVCSFKIKLMEKPEKPTQCPFCGEYHYPFSGDATPWTEPECLDD